MWWVRFEGNENLFENLDILKATIMRLLANHKEKDLIKSLRQGDIKAFDEIYFRYVPRLLAFSRTFFLVEQEAEEAVQEIFIKIWEKRQNLDEERNFKSYLFQSVKNHIFNRLRDIRKTCTLEDIPEESQPVQRDLLEDLDYRDMEATAFTLIGNLPKVQQEVFLLSKMEGLSNAEIAVKLNLSKRTVEHHIYLATKFLKGELVYKASVYGALWIICLG